MEKTGSSLLDLSYLDTLAYQDTPVHRLDPRVKLLTTLLFIVCVVSFNKYELASLVPFVIYPAVLVALGNLPLGYLLKKVLLAAPFALLVGIFNPLLDRAVLIHLGSVEISGGWVSFASIMLRFVLTVSAALILVASTGFNAVCVALERMGAPAAFTVQLLFLYRYIFVLGDEAARMVRARALRSFGRRGMALGVFSLMIGQLLLRTLDRAQRIHLAMRCRGFDGEIPIARRLRIAGRDLVFLLACSALFFFLRLHDVPQWLGDTAMGLMR